MHPILDHQLPISSNHLSALPGRRSVDSTHPLTFPELPGLSPVVTQFTHFHTLPCFIIHLELTPPLAGIPTVSLAKEMSTTLPTGLTLGTPPRELQTGPNDFW